jgi:hypothetical protein
LGFLCWSWLICIGFGVSVAMPTAFSSQAAESLRAGFLVSNDAKFLTLGLLLDEDRYYSQGIHLFWSNSPHEIFHSSGPIGAMGKALGSQQAASGIRFGQDIFTPNDLRVVPPLIADDRPFLGWTHLDLLENFYRVHGQSPTRLQLEIDLGVVGPASLGKEIQTWWHENRRQSSSHPELDPDPSAGWTAQYGKKDFPGRAQVALNYAMALPALKLGNRFSLESGTEAGTNVGFLYGYVETAVQIRVGWMTRSMYLSQPQGNRYGWEGFVFLRENLQAVGWNEVLTGGNSSEVKAANFVLQQEIGWVIRAPFPGPELAWTWSLWSRETIRNPKEPFQPGHIDYRERLLARSPWFDHGFGTVGLTWAW